MLWLTALFEPGRLFKHQRFDVPEVSHQVSKRDFITCPVRIIPQPRLFTHDYRSNGFYPCRLVLVVVLQLQGKCFHTRFNTMIYECLCARPDSFARLPFPKVKCFEEERLKFKQQIVVCSLQLYESAFE